VWLIASRGLAAAGEVPPELGEPAEDGVYTLRALGGSSGSSNSVCIYFRRVAASASAGVERAEEEEEEDDEEQQLQRRESEQSEGMAPAARPAMLRWWAWEFSVDGRLWLPTLSVDRWGCPLAPLDKLLIQRLEVESLLAAAGALAAGGGNGNGAIGAPAAAPPPPARPPPLDLSWEEEEEEEGEEVDGGRRARSPSPSSSPPPPPEAFLCPLSMAVMRDPVVAPSGTTYDRSALLQHLRRTGTDPATGHPLRSDRLYANLAVRDAICKWAVERAEARRERRRARRKAVGGSSGGGGAESGGFTIGVGAAPSSL
jgi:hypothetical protein